MEAPLLQMREGQLRRQVDITTALYSSVQQDLERARADEVRDTPVMGAHSGPAPLGRVTSDPGDLTSHGGADNGCRSRRNT